MTFSIKTIFFTTFLFACLQSVAQDSYIDSDQLKRLIFKAEKYVYNLEYDSAEVVINKIESSIPDSPLPDLLYAMNRMWQSMPDAYPDDFDEIISYMDKALDKSKKLMKKERNNAEAAFFTLVCHGLKAQYYNDRGSPFKALGEAQNAYDFVFIGMKLQEEFPEFYFTSGLYNYYREKYPEVYPVYKPLVWIFKKGDKELGLEQIQYSIDHAPFSSIEASHYLAFIYLRYELLPDRAYEILSALIKEYPNNPYFRSLYLETLYVINRIGEGRGSIQLLSESKNKFFIACGMAYDAFYDEKVNNDDQSAESKYKQCLKLSENIEASTGHMQSICFAGLGRIYDRNGDQELARDYFKKASKDALQPAIKNESELYLDKR